VSRSDSDLRQRAVERWPSPERGSAHAPVSGEKRGYDLTSPLELGMQGPQVADLHAVLGELGLDVAREEADAQRYGDSTEASVRSFQHSHGLPETGVVDSETASLLAALPEASKLSRTVSGAVVFDYGLPASGIVVRAYTRGYGDKDELLVESETDSTGHYSLAYRTPGRVNLELRTVDAAKNEVTLSATRFDAGMREHSTWSRPRPSARWRPSTRGLPRTSTVQSAQARLQMRKRRTVARISPSRARSPGGTRACWRLPRPRRSTRRTPACRHRRSTRSTAPVYPRSLRGLRVSTAPSSMRRSSAPWPGASSPVPGRSKPGSWSRACSRRSASTVFQLRTVVGILSCRSSYAGSFVRAIPLGRCR
jgi:peptidoglycan hydrolase-like protein with peptidoglycan-binding domain